MERTCGSAAMYLFTVALDSLPPDLFGFREQAITGPNDDIGCEVRGGVGPDLVSPPSRLASLRVRGPRFPGHHVVEITRNCPAYGMISGSGFWDVSALPYLRLDTVRPVPGIGLSREGR